MESVEEAQRAVDEMLALGAMEVKTGMDPGQDPAHLLDDLPDEIFSAICAGRQSGAAVPPPILPKQKNCSTPPNSA